MHIWDRPLLLLSSALMVRVTFTVLVEGPLLDNNTALGGIWDSTFRDAVAVEMLPAMSKSTDTVVIGWFRIEFLMAE